MSRRRQGTVGHFAQIPEEVMSSPAWTTLKHSARTTLQVLAVQFHGSHNGIQVLTATTCETYGVTRTTALRDAQELERRGLIVKTYQARFKPAPQRRIPSQWALGWRAITHRKNTLLDRPEPAPNGWANWEPDNFSTVLSEHCNGALSAPMRGV